MSNPITVTVINSLHDLTEYCSSFNLCVSAFLDDSIKEFSALTDFHNKIDVSGIFECFVELNDVWVIKLTHDFDFSLESFFVFDCALGNLFNCSHDL